VKRHLPTILLAVSLPVGALGYAVAGRILSMLALPEGVGDILILFVPLLVAGLCMLPFLVPYFDRKAKQDLAAYRRTQGLGREAGDRETRDRATGDRETGGPATGE
jgi:hypothetical protein